MIRTLIAGLGSIGRRHLRNLIALGETDVILLRSQHATMPENELAGYPVETDVREALERHRPAAVIVANPTALHLGVAIPAAEAGCAILIEKPVSHSLAGLDRLEAAVTEGGAKVLVGFQFRFHPVLVRARRWIAEGELGRIMSAHVNFGEYLPAWHPWEDYRRGYAARADLGGGVLTTQCHSLDYLPWIVGKADAAWGFLAKLSGLEIDVEDTAEVGLRFSQGTLASVHLDYAQRPSSHQLEISGTRGTLQCDLLSGTARIFRVENDAWENYAVPAGWERNVMFVDEMRHFLAVARGEAASACTLQDGIRVTRLIAAVQQSQASGAAVSLG